MPQATALDEHRSDASRLGEGRLPYREHGCKVSASAYGIHTISLACRELDPAFVAPLFSSSTVDRETGEKVTFQPYVSCRQLRHSGTGLVLTWRATNSGHLLTLEGAASSLLAGDRQFDDLLPPSRLPAVEDAVREQAGRIGLEIPLGASLKVHRADLATDIRTESDFGMSILSGFGSLALPARRAEIRTEIGSPATESVTWSGASGATALRLYDRNARAANEFGRNLGPRGERLRLEREVRPRAHRQESPESFAGRDLSRLYIQPFRGWLKNKTVIVSDYGLADTIIQQRAVSYRTAITLLGIFTRFRERGFDAWDNRRSALRHLAKLRDHGICPSAFGNSSIAVGEVLTAFTQPWRAT